MVDNPRPPGLLQRIVKLEKIGTKPSSRMNHETGEMITKFYRNPKGILSKKAVIARYA